MLTDFDGLEKNKTYCYIHCDIIENRNGIWMYKALSEACYPEYYSCPLSYLAKANLEINQEWRLHVRLHNQQHNR